MQTKLDLELEFSNIAKRLQLQRPSSIGPKQLAQIDKITQLSPEKQKLLINLRKLKWISIVIAVLLIVMIVRMELYTSKGLAHTWLSWKRRNIYAEQCVVDMPTVAQDIFRPPVDCTMCTNVQQVDKVSAISPQEFREKYAYSGHPVIVTDATVNWTARTTFNFDFLKQLYGDSSPALENYRQSCQFFPYQTEFRSLRQVFNMSEERAQLKDGSKPWYVGWSNCDSSVANLLRKSYGRPYFLPEDSESSKTDWIFMGSPGYGAHMHIDHVGNPSWQAQISGQKRWLLLPPPECFYQCQPLDTIVQPGEIIVLDTNSWFHRTLIVGEDISITIGSEYD